MLTDVHPEGVAGWCCVFNCQSIASLSPSLAPDGKEMLGGLFEWQAMVPGVLSVLGGPWPRGDLWGSCCPGWGRSSGVTHLCSSA